MISNGWEPFDNKDTVGPDGEKIDDHLVDGRIRMICNRGIYCHKKEEPTATEEQVPDDTEDDAGYLSESNIDYLAGDSRPPVNIGDNKFVPRSYRPVKGKEPLCPFKFQIYWSKEHQRWYFPKEQAGCTKHCGHIQREPEECKRTARHCGLDTLKLAESGFAACLRSTQISELIEMVNGTTVDPKTMRDYANKLRKVGVFDDDAVTQLQTGSTDNAKAKGNKYKPTSADKLLANLRKRKDASYTALYGKWDSNLLKVYKQTKLEMGELVVEEVDPSELDENEEEEKIEEYAARIRDALKITGTTNILLGIAWTSDEAHRLLEMFPEFSGSDVTHGTNAEKRKLMTFCGKDGNNKAFVHTYAFMPSERRWAFNWFFGTATPKLHGTKPLDDLIVQLMDQCDQEKDGFNDAKALGLYKNAERRICSFHKIDRNFVSGKEYATAVTDNNEDINSKIELKMLGTWMFMFPMEYETKEECDASIHLLDEYMKIPKRQKHGELKEPLKTGAIDFLHTKFVDQGSQMFRWKYFDRATFDNHTTGVNEGAHRGMKASSIGPDACDTIDVSQGRIDKWAGKNHRKRNKEATNDMSSSALTEEDSQEDSSRMDSKLQQVHTEAV